MKKIAFLLIIFFILSGCSKPFDKNVESATVPVKILTESWQKRNREKAYKIFTNGKNISNLSIKEFNEIFDHQFKNFNRYKIIRIKKDTFYEFKNNKYLRQSEAFIVYVDLYLNDTLINILSFTVQKEKNKYIIVGWEEQKELFKVMSNKK